MRLLTNGLLWLALALLAVAVSLLSMGCDENGKCYDRHGTFPNRRTYEVTCVPTREPTPAFDYYGKNGGYNVGDHVMYMPNLYAIQSDGYIIATSARWAKVDMLDPNAPTSLVLPCERHRGFGSGVTEWVAWDHILEHVEKEAK